MSETHSEIGPGPEAKTADDQGRQLAWSSQEQSVRLAESVQTDLIFRMTSGGQLEITQELYETAWQLKKTGPRHQHPDWSDAEFCVKCRRVFLTES